ncbi:MAG: Asp-tRNA(Asn)/Glu-tRNA(Gln) amidotransferase subunit GatA [Lachnospiraceae bacterium]|nr:Asp-tRNA(Asn)/Glu-tRNA(Gln) amidotransferase subunit GatA [Lachnospiraceae bacterium]
MAKALLSLSAAQLSERIRNKEIRITDVLDAVFETIQKREQELGAFITVDEKGAREQGDALQRRLDVGEDPGPLCGVPMAIKDNICVKGLPTTCGSRMLKEFVPTYDAEVIKRLREAGAIFIGKTNMDEFGMGSYGETSFFGACKNPLDLTKVAGGSSAGSAAAVAAGEAFLALGSDTGGSVRTPAAFCGIVGFKPSYGAVSRRGLVAYASSMDQIGPMAKNVEDAALLLQVIAGEDPMDATSRGLKESVWPIQNRCDLSGIRIGIPSGWLQDQLSGGMRQNLEQAAAALRDLGAAVETFDLGYEDLAVAAYYTIADAQCSSNLARFDGMKYGYRTQDPAASSDLHRMLKQSRSEGFGREVKRRIMLGGFVLSEGYYEAYYLRALKVCRLIREAFTRAFEHYDLLLGPVSGDVAPPLGASFLDNLKMYESDCYTVPANLAGLCALSLPFGANENGLPYGIQLLGDTGCEKGLLEVAALLEAAALPDGYQQAAYGEKGGDLNGECL